MIEQVLVELKDGRLVLFDGERIDYDCDQHGNLVVERWTVGKLERLGMWSPELWRSVTRSEVMGGGA